MIKPVDVLAFGAHPDDIELGAAGTLLSCKAKGKSLGLVDLTRGELGTRGNPELRRLEATEAASILGADFRYNCGFKDGKFAYDEQHLQLLISIVRKAKPELVLANALEDRHPDHARAAKLVADACFYAGLVQWQDPENLPAHRPRLLLHYIQFQNLKPDILLSIDGFFEAKMNSILAYASQFYKVESQEPETPISNQTFLESLKGRAQDWGKIIGVSHAEGFNSSRPLGVEDLFNLR
ncbi:MAG: bacillithiol biosynthesis deacetylase BshB1 [Bacteroidetes bacterium]|nr:bacillithiol biosynthesis deacetylase BshB1 [Bacteroidota bacterium]